MQKKDWPLVIAENCEIAPNCRQIRLSGNAPEFIPGQFFMFSVPGHTLRRAFAPSHSDRCGFTFTCALVGEGTRAIADLSVGTSVQVLAPLGNGYSLDGLNPREHTPILLGGGCGAPSLVLLAKTLQERGFAVRAVTGARTAAALLAADDLKPLCAACTAATDDGSAGFHGNVIAAADALRQDIKNTPVIFACGPRPMLRAAAAWAAAGHFACQVSLEERMGCGFGACMGCAVKIKAPAGSGREYLNARVCHDGPVFPADAVIWE